VGGLFSRFLSPLRATVPLVSGASGTSLAFQLANVSSGLLWPLLLLAPRRFSLSFGENYCLLKRFLTPRYALELIL
jgi:membrane protein DedA with SNARE-associated domain